MIPVILGMLAGFVIAMVVMKPKTIGDLRIDRSDPYDEPLMFLELDKSVGDVSRRKYVVFKVKNEDYISHQ